MATHQEKKEIRIEINNLLSSECGTCEYRTGYDHMSYCIRECPIGRKMQELSSRLVRDSKQTLMPLEERPLKAGSWSKEEELYLLNHSRHFSIAHLAMRLRRSPSTVTAKLHSLRKNQRGQAG
ncbi:zinc-finger domain-containing protein [Bacillus infantis]|uniref:Zinc-finger domain-containing protein n=1 Tax=Bacillus infantis TaxID=324767 RepID=A0A5D4RL15_9BACI|nr:zinc-finger domain-containing protein [Bacillus infantis]